MVSVKDIDSGNATARLQEAFATAKRSSLKRSLGDLQLAVSEVTKFRKGLDITTEYNKMKDTNDKFLLANPGTPASGLPHPNPMPNSSSSRMRKSNRRGPFGILCVPGRTNAKSCCASRKAAYSRKAFKADSEPRLLTLFTGWDRLLSYLS